MTQTLTQHIASVQAYLIDDGTRFTTATCTAAIRQALKTWNIYLPINAATLIDAVTDQKDYELTDFVYAYKALDILDILEWDSDGDDHIHQNFTEWSEDDRLFFRIETPLNTGDFILARFTIPHTINGLDSETDSTLSSFYNTILILGSAAEACAIRSRGRTETINLQDRVTINYADLAKELKTQFLSDLLAISTKKKFPVSYPNNNRWVDKWEQSGWDI